MDRIRRPPETDLIRREQLLEEGPARRVGEDVGAGPEVALRRILQRREEQAEVGARQVAVHDCDRDAVASPPADGLHHGPDRRERRPSLRGTIVRDQKGAPGVGQGRRFGRPDQQGEHAREHVARCRRLAEVAPVGRHAAGRRGRVACRGAECLSLVHGPPWVWISRYRRGRGGWRQSVAARAPPAPGAGPGAAPGSRQGFTASYRAE